MKIWKLILLSAAIMLGLPWLAVTFVPADAAMAVCLLLFFAVDPVYSAICGAFAGKNAKKLWFQPIFPPLFFLAGVWWIISSPFNPDFLPYAVAYLLLGYLAMAVSAVFRSKK